MYNISTTNRLLQEYQATASNDAMFHARPERLIAALNDASTNGTASFMLLVASQTREAIRQCDRGDAASIQLAKRLLNALVRDLYRRAEDTAFAIPRLEKDKAIA